MMGKKSGLDNIEVWSKKLGIELTEDEAMDVLMAVKLKSHDLKRVLTEEEFKEVAENIKSNK
jgi:hypothetical protein